jgi:peptidoglycan lytic transglycosylase
MRRRIAYGLTLVLTVVSLGAAQGPHRSESGQTRRTTPVRQTKPYQTGTASWYGASFQGKDTASGEPYNMYDMTAAHPTLPLGTMVRVTNLHNGRSVTVRINDRGPIIAGRIIDVSLSAARALRFKEKGLQRVRLDLVVPQPPVLIAQAMAQ